MRAGRDPPVTHFSLDLLQSESSGPRIRFVVTQMVATLQCNPAAASYAISQLIRLQVWMNEALNFTERSRR